MPMQPGTAMSNFAKSGVGGPGGGANQAMNIARRMQNVPRGMNAVPGAMTAGGSSATGLQSGGSPQAQYEQNVIRQMPMADQKAYKGRVQKEAARTTEPMGMDTKALKELSSLMGPGVPNPFEEMGSETRDPRPPGFAEGEHPMPRAAPYSIRQEPPAGDVARSLDKMIPVILRYALAKYMTGKYEPAASHEANWTDQPIEHQIRELGHKSIETTHESMPELQDLPIDEWPVIPTEGRTRNVTGDAAIRHGRQQKPGSKRGGAAKKALSVAKRKKRRTK